MTCLRHVYHLVTVLIILSTIMFPVDFVIVSVIMLSVDFATLPDACYTSYGDLLLMHMYTLLCIYILFCIAYMLPRHNTVLWLHCICPAACLLLSRHHQHVHLYYVTTGYDYRHDPIITGQAVIVLKYDMFIFCYCLLYTYYMVSLGQHHVLYICIVLVLLQYILLPPSFYHSLGRFLTTLGLRAQVGDPRYRLIRQCLGVIQEIPHRDYAQVSLGFISVILFIPVFISVMITNLFLQVFLYLFPAGTLVYMEAMSCTEA